MKVAIYGGTFDPVHTEHVNIARAVLRELSPEKLIILPAGVPPHKGGEVTAAKHRVGMCRAAFDGENVEVDLFEVEKEGKSFTFETAEHFHKKYGEKPFFILGGDSLRDFWKWRNPEKILEHAELVCVEREGVDHSESNVPHRTLSYRPEGVSSTELRVLLEFDMETDGLMPKKVRSYVHKHKLYQTHAKLIEKIEPMMKKKRFIHTANVVAEGQRLAVQLGVDKEKAFLACALHDVCKAMTHVPKEYEQELLFDMPDPCPPVEHAFLGSYVARDLFDIEDEDVLNAIKFHTTGRANMSRLEQLVFIADLIEKGRSFEGVDRLRELVHNDFDEGFYVCLKSQCEFIEQKDCDRRTREAVEFYDTVYQQKKVENR